MAAFTEEQTKTLEAMFAHMWARMSSLHDDINEDSARLGALLVALYQKGTITQDQVTAIVKILSMEASENREPVTDMDVIENDITRKLLHGDLLAFDRIARRTDQ